ncbi:NfeD family protein [Nocardiopsis composta]|uniref:Membrane protein implicated in regulation of membrane protease activity n=1 Tax=Nocardiopsis composta TaxID=157465 RepID=A0A7W8VGJ6_9ACTN|nr:NfeD family protein [Nocardiopsis composta]MBB5435233.1 membrane protein implicated in regulation of membrane protease activity [Nocardiopsis composta]
MPLWILWIVAAVALGIAEALTLTLSLGLLAVAALVAAVVGALGMGVAAQVIAFVVASAAGVLVVRPIARRHLRQPPLLASGTAALIGKSGVVLEEVTGDHGLIKLSGEEWSARALDEEHVIPAGTHVDVMEIDGATAVVYPREALP